MKIPLFLSVLLFLCTFNTLGSSPLKKSQDSTLKHSVFIDPLLPFFNLVIVNYGYKLKKSNELIAGLVLSKSTTTPTKYYDYPGDIKSISPIFGYRQYFYKGLHLEYWLMPGYNRYNDKTKQKHYNSFSIYNEIRLGYNFEFAIAKVPVLLNAQWPVGFSLYNSNIPDSFSKIDKKDPVFYLFIPNIWIGVRF